MTQTAPTSIKDLDFAPKHDVFPSPRDWRDHFLYQLLIDRFDDASPEAPPYDAATAKRGRNESKADKFQGGQIKGITRRLDYIKGLGCTAIWVGPPFKNRQEDDTSGHGYAVQNFLEIDPRLGTLDDLKELVREAHARDMYVILDIVINHTGDVWGYVDDAPHPYHEEAPYPFGHWRGLNGKRIPHERVSELEHEEGIWPIELQDPDCFHRRGQIRNMDSYTREEGTLGDFFALKDLDLTNPKTLDALVACYKYWIAECDIDGYRLDTVTHTEPEQTAIFCNAMREYAKSIGKDNFFLYAEIVAGDERLQKYIGQNTPIPDEPERYPVFSACLDFPLYFVLEEVIKGFEPPTRLRERYESFRNFYRDYGEAGQYFVTFVDNHDQIGRNNKRFMAGVTDHRQAILAIGYLLTNMGIPCIYYGTEQGFDGCGKDDKCVRENMFGGEWGAFDTTGYSFFNANHPIYQGIAKVAAIRSEERALRYGREYFREISGDGENFGHPQHGVCTLAFSRVLDTTEILVALNLDENNRDDRVLVDAKLTAAGSTMVDLLNGGKYTVEPTKDGHAFVRLPLKGRTMAILKKTD